jgi:DNA transposition AAA+ family ATPase
VTGFMELIFKLQKREPGLPNMGAMFGHSGWGKTQAAIYAQNSTRAVVVEVSESWSAKKLWTEILKEAFVQQPKGTAADLQDEVAMVLGDQPDRPLILDEADKLIARGLIEKVREVADKAQVPVLLVGEEKLLTKLEREPRVFGRLLSWYAAQPADLGDCRILARALMGNIAVDEPLLAQVRQEANGRIRLIMNTLYDMRAWAINNRVETVTKANYQGEIFTGKAPQPRSDKLAQITPKAGRIA